MGNIENISKYSDYLLSLGYKNTLKKMICKSINYSVEGFIFEVIHITYTILYLIKYKNNIKYQKMFEYPDCDAKNCWYSNNFIRLNEYSESKTYVINRDIDRRRYDLSDYSLPLEVTLCDVDIPNTVGKCSLCEKYMIDKWINEDFIICRMCIDDSDIDCEVETDEERFDEIFDITQGDYVDYLEDLGTSDPKDRYLYDYLRGIILKIYNEKYDEKHKEIQELLFESVNQQTHNIKMLCDMFPSLNEIQAEEIHKKYDAVWKDKIENPDIYTFLMKLLDKAN